MKEITKVVVDAMGGDNAPHEIIKGAVEAVGKSDAIHVILVGKEDVINQELSGYTYNKEQISVVHTSEVIEKAARQLDEFFAGKRKEFDVPLLFVGTDFQKTVWNELLEIPFGKTVSYGEMAQRIGMSKAVRAVANANGANSISIFAPCHRVIGSDRSLTGYGGGLPAKKFLLELESQPRLAL